MSDTFNVKDRLVEYKLYYDVILFYSLVTVIRRRWKLRKKREKLRSTNASNMQSAPRELPKATSHGRL